MGSLGTLLRYPDDIYPLLKMKRAIDNAEKQIPPQPHWGFCYSMLHKVSRSFSLVIQQLNTELRNAVSEEYTLVPDTLYLTVYLIDWFLHGTMWKDRDFNCSASLICSLLRLALSVDHPYIVVYSNSSGANVNLLHENKQECGLCHDPAEDYVVTSCAHVFCKACLIGFSTSLGKVTCPASKTTLTGFKASNILSQIKLDDLAPETSALEH